MKIKISNHLILTELPSDLCQEIKARLTMDNPAYVEAEKMGRWTGRISEKLYFYHSEPGGRLSVPRGFLPQLVSLARQHGEILITDQRRTLPEVDFTFAGALKPFQEEAVDRMMEADEGTMSAPTGSGKTVMALKIIADRRQPTLIIVHTKELLHQWGDRIETFLGIPKADIGIIGGGKKKIGEKITVGIVNSIYPIAGELKHHFGHLVVDECHRTPSRTFTEAVTAFDSKYMLGLSATPYRRDGLSKLIFWHLGDCLHRIDQVDLQEAGHIVPAEVILRPTGYVPPLDMAAEYSTGLSVLTEDGDRNRLISVDVAREAGNGGGVCLLLTDRREHCERLWILLRRQGINAELLHGRHSPRDRQEVIERLNTGEVPVLVATGQLIGEGFDCRELSTLFMATPISFSGRVIQYLGRVLRPAPGKHSAKVFDYLDNNPVLMAAARKRQKIYEGNGWRVMSC